ncbi:hypothetical protein LQ327_00725 [Actinomycetospora endophytica]|uniref:DUF1345 domain-containing protein n=1 Tax=Actinomycetospora endophytica TaxID=2291215 RepID=A0ABS8P0Z1_9PSEU|nr:hypothetical protein [Actinomycetospora endophytica]MCD2191913.1 hypothetical protein [Actinomycetospora endophytica]
MPSLPVDDAGPVPAPARPRPEPRWPMVLAVTVAIALQVALPGRFAPGHRLVPFLELVLLIGLFLANPGRIDRRAMWLRRASIALIAMISATNAWSAVRLVLDIIGGAADDAIALLSSGASIWATNVIVFGLWYWEFDRGGPHTRVYAPPRFPDFAFPQDQDPALARPGWSPRFVDYLYMSFTNATAFSPTDVMPLARWAKLTMMTQSAISLATVTLVVARAIGLFK